MTNEKPASPTQGELAVKVKPLGWDEIDERLWGAQPFHGFCYEISVTDRGDTRVRWPENGGWESFNGTLEDAKAACQADFEAKILSALDRTTLPPTEEDHSCPICLKPFKPNDLCATDIELGICHAECLEGCPTVDLETGEPVDGPIPTYRYDEAETAPGVKSAFQAGFEAGEAAGKFGDDSVDEAWDRYAAAPQGKRT